MDQGKYIVLSLLTLFLLAFQANAIVPYGYGRSFWEDMMLPQEDPFKILEHTPLTIPKGIDHSLALAHTDWKETPAAHIISLDIPGIKKEDVKIEIEENRLLRITGERKTEEEVKDEKWHRAERTTGKFWRQLRLPANADLEKVKAHLENGVLRITVPKLAEEKKRSPKLINIAEEAAGSGEDIKATKAEIKS